MTFPCSLALGLAAALATAGCSIGGLGSIGPVAAAPPAPPPVAYGAFLDGPVGQKLSAADRDKALAAEQDALASGQRRTWKGERGTFGYVEPAASPPVAEVAAAEAVAAASPSPAVGAETCRSFTSTIYIAGRPQVGHGKGCPGPDGSYRVTG